jgi:HEAT repeat protein
MKKIKIVFSLAGLVFLSAVINSNATSVSVEELIKSLESKDVTTREMAAAELIKFGPSAIRPLVIALQKGISDKNYQSCDYIWGVIYQIGAPGVPNLVGILDEAIKTEDGQMVSLVVELLVHMGATATRPLIEALDKTMKSEAPRGKPRGIISFPPP